MRSNAGGTALPEASGLVKPGAAEEDASTPGEAGLLSAKLGMRGLFSGESVSTGSVVVGMPVSHIGIASLTTSASGCVTSSQSATRAEYSCKRSARSWTRSRSCGAGTPGCGAGATSLRSGVAALARCGVEARVRRGDSAAGCAPGLGPLLCTCGKRSACRCGVSRARGSPSARGPLPAGRDGPGCDEPHSRPFEADAVSLAFWLPIFFALSGEAAAAVPCSALLRSAAGGAAAADDARLEPCAESPDAVRPA